MLSKYIAAIAAVVVALMAVDVRDARADHLRDLAQVAGARDNQLVGYGIVTGLTNTGDDITVPFTAQTVTSLMRRLGIQVDPTQLRLRNVAAVIVTATLPPFAKPGTKIDVTVASIGNARSISGGMLVQTLLKGADQRAYAAAQGSVLLGGFDVRGQSGSSARSGTVTAGRIPGGAIIEREVTTSVVNDGRLKLELRTPGFTVASRVAAAVNAKFGEGTASALDGGAVSVRIPAAYGTRTVDLIAELEALDVQPDRRARVVVNERTGTVVAGGDVRLAPVAVLHGNLSIVVKEAPAVSQPFAPFGSTGTTAVVPRSDVKVEDSTRSVAYLPGAPTLSDVAASLKSLGLSARELVSVLEALRAAGALEAELVVQ